MMTEFIVNKLDIDHKPYHECAKKIVAVSNLILEKKWENHVNL